MVCLPLMHQDPPLETLHKIVQEHPFWNNSLFQACRQGELTKQDFAYIFSQYYLYSRNFTRYLAAVMASCDNDRLRNRLAQNLWEESGIDQSRTHAEIFRTFLTCSLGIHNLEAIQYTSSTQFFAQEYQRNAACPDPIWSSAWLSLGTEGIVSRMYQIFVEGLCQAGIPDSELEFFHIHIDCDDEHAATLAEIMCFYSDRPGWFEMCQQAAEQALSLRANFFEHLYEEILQSRSQALFEVAKNRCSLVAQVGDLSQLKHSHSTSGNPIYSNVNERLNIEFSVERMLFPATQVLDPRIVRIPAGKANERHRHAHETLFYILEGSGTVLIDEAAIEVTAGDAVFIPRWCIHQSRNTGTDEMVILAVTDFGLTSKLLGNYDQKTRMKVLST
ncbi:cupin domain-containing protein [Leptolyngbya sp. NK1-12]|uniref:Cupin domain-containing protein n=1 Tax=Leptolyngbya sp. NK1-12 TaxID=2547451 RepID=A0AA96WIZ7_9CYAN|nr:cupin domain-containing protein [Leptolyngbya sp. NK1-12]